jgi:hypothetical protein
VAAPPAASRIVAPGAVALGVVALAGGLAAGAVVAAIGALAGVGADWVEGAGADATGVGVTFGIFGATSAPDVAVGVVGPVAPTLAGKRGAVVRSPAATGDGTGEGARAVLAPGGVPAGRARRT